MEANKMINISDIIAISKEIIENSKQVKVDSSVRKPYVVTRRRFYNDKQYIGSIESCLTWGYLRVDFNGNIQEINEPNLTFAETMILENYIGWLRSEVQSTLENIKSY